MKNVMLGDLENANRIHVDIIALAVGNRIAERIKLAVRASQDKGATLEQLKPIQDELVTLNTESQDLAASIATHIQVVAAPVTPEVETKHKKH